MLKYCQFHCTFVDYSRFFFDMLFFIAGSGNNAPSSHIGALHTTLNHSICHSACSLNCVSVVKHHIENKSNPPCHNIIQKVKWREVLIFIEMCIKIQHEAFQPDIYYLFGVVPASNLFGITYPAGYFCTHS